MTGLKFSPDIEGYSAEDFLEAVPELFDMAEIEILISTLLDQEFYKDSNIKRSLQDAIDKGVDVKILLDKDAYPLSEIGWLYDLYQNCNVDIRRSRKKVPHKIIVDELHLRWETEHPKGNYEDVENEVIKFAFGLALKEKFNFLDIWEGAVREPGKPEAES